MNQQILRQIQADPAAQQAVGQAVQEILNDSDISPEAVAQLIQIIETTMQNPGAYPQTRAAMIQSNLVDPEDLPEEYDEVLLTVLLIALKLVQQNLQSGPAFARGGLNRVARMGRNGDTMLAHINADEARLLRAHGGAGTINPRTGLPEFWSLKKAFKSIVKAVAPVLPIVLSVVAPGLGTAIGSALGASGALASALGGAAIGGLSSAAAGGNALQGALGGALGAGAGGALGGTVSEALGANLGSTAQNVVGSALLGGAAGAASGQGVGAGLAQGALGGYMGSTLSNAASGVGGQVGAGLQTAGQQFGNALSMGATPTQALTAGALSGIAAGLSAPAPKSPYDLTPADSGGLGLKTPSELAVEGLKAPALNTASIPEAGLGMNYGLTAQNTPTFKGPDTLAADYSLYGGSPTQATSAQPELGTGIQSSPLSTIASQTAATTPGTSGTVGNAPATKGFGLGEMGNMANLLPALALFGSAQTPQQIQQAVSGMSPAQREYFNRALYTFDWDKIQSAAQAANMGLGEFVAKSWNNIAQDTGYAKPYATIQQEVPKARGGAVHGYAMGGYASGGALSRLAHGGGSGRDDTISARLSDGEYVMDAETVALLGDGSTREGASRLDHMRAQLRRQKGKALAQGKFSPDAKSPLQYMKKGKV